LISKSRSFYSEDNFFPYKEQKFSSDVFPFCLLHYLLLNEIYQD